MKTRELVLELKAAGCYIKRNGSNHDIWFSPITNKSCPIPRHQSKELGTGIELKIRQTLGVTKSK